MSLCDWSSDVCSSDLAQDPRPQYQDDPERVYGMAFAGLEVKFQVAGDRLAVTEIL